MTLLLRALFPWVLLLVPFPCAAGTAAAGEIRHLLVFIEQSGCTFIRNGREYTAAEARGHIEKKDARIRERIRTAEEWIDHAAARSSLSGRPYRVRCNAAEMYAADWLLAELARIRLE